MEITGVLLEQMRRNGSNDYLDYGWDGTGRKVCCCHWTLPIICPSIRSLPVCIEYSKADSGDCYSLLYPMWPPNQVFLKSPCLSPAPGLLYCSNYQSRTLVGSLPGSLSSCPSVWFLITSQELRTLGRQLSSLRKPMAFHMGNHVAIYKSSDSFTGSLHSLAVPLKEPWQRFVPIPVSQKWVVLILFHSSHFYFGWLE